MIGPCAVCGALAPASASPRPVDRASRAWSALTGGVRRARAATRRVTATAAAGLSGATVIEPGWVLACDDHDRLELRRGHSVVVEGTDIVAVTPDPPRGRVHRVRAPGSLLVAGFISGHTHVAAGTVTRGLIEGGRSYARPLELAEELDDDDLDALTAHNLAELLLSGCTTQVEMSLSLRQMESYLRVADAWGVRGYPSAMVPGIGRLFEVWFRDGDDVLHDSVPGSLEEIVAARDLGLAHNGAGDGRIRPQAGIHATDTQTPETMRAHAAAAAELGNGVHLHLSQNAAETETTLRLWGRRPAQWIGDFDLAGAPLFAAHLTGADLDHDLAELRELGATAVHNPSAGGAGATTQPWPELLGAGVRTSLGIDTHSNDYLENLKLAVLYGRVRHALLSETSDRPMTRPGVVDAVQAATIGPATGLGRRDLGRIIAGARADLVLIDVTGPPAGTGALPPEPLHNLLYASGSAVTDVMTDGRWQVRNGHLVVDDEDRVLRRGGQVVAAVWERLAAEGWME